MPDRGEPVRLGPGDVAVTRGPDHYTVADDPASPPDVVIHPGQRCCSPDGESMEEEMSLGVRTWGNDPDGSTVMLVGAYESMGDISDRLLRALPPLLSLANDQWDSPLVSLLCDEVVEGRARSGGRARPLDRPAAHRRAAGLVHSTRGRGAGLVPIPGRSDRRAGAAHHARQPRPRRGRWPASPPRSACRARRSPAGFTTSWANRR